MKANNENSTQLLGRLEESIDGILDSEMSSTLQNIISSGPAVGGELSDLDMPLLLGRMFVDGTTGRLRVRNEQTEKLVYFEAGFPVMAASDDAADRMLAMLIREGVLDARQNDETIRVVDATGRKVGAVLVDLGFLRSDELLPSVRRHYESIILSLFSWTLGHWQVDPNVTAGPDRTRLLRHPVVLVREGLGHGYPANKISARLGTGKNVFLLDSSTGASDITSQVALDKTELRVPLLFDGVRSLDDVVRVSGISENVVLRIALTLSCFGVLRPVEGGVSSHENSRLGLRDLSIDRERIQARYAIAMESDYFAVLSVDRRADAHDVRRAYGRLSRELAPEAVGPELWHELRQQIETIQEVLGEALRVLSTPVLRSAYEFNLAHGPDADPESDVRDNNSPMPPRPPGATSFRR